MTLSEYLGIIGFLGMVFFGILAYELASFLLIVPFTLALLVLVLACFLGDKEEREKTQ